ncbi:MAG: winged helix-turn-helix domain-containing protein, partial [Candidatus Promineifilaceae bacterium]
MELTQKTESRWKKYPETYRSAEMKTIANWIHSGMSGVIVGLPGMGRTTLISYLWHRQEVLRNYLPDDARETVFIPVDLNILPKNDVSTFYRVILRSFYQVRQQFATHISEAVGQLYKDNRATRDPFMPQSALLELLDLFDRERIRVVWLLNFFDEFCRHTSAVLIRTLRSLRDHYKDSLHFLIGLQQEIHHFVDLGNISPLYHILDRNVLWVGGLSLPDTSLMLAREFQYLEQPPSKANIEALWHLTGGIPNLVRVSAQWYREQTEVPPQKVWEEQILVLKQTQERLQQIWRSITEAEKLALAALQTERVSRPSRKKKAQGIQAQHIEALEELEKKGLVKSVDNSWKIVSSLFADFSRHAKQGRGRIWFDQVTNQFYQGQSRVEGLSGLEHALLFTLHESPQTKLTHSEMIESAWPEDVWKEGVSTDALYQHMSSLRRKVEPSHNKHLYIIKWRGQPEGGYQ